MNVKDVGDFNGRRLYIELRLDYRLRLWAHRGAISAVADLVSHAPIVVFLKAVRT